MNDPEMKEKTVGFDEKKSNLAVFMLAVIAGILTFAYVLHAGEPGRIDRIIKIRAKKLRETKKYIAQNYDSLITMEKQSEKQALTQDKPLLTIIKESTESVGLTPNLSGVIPEENKKLREVTAKVVLRRVRLADVVNFLVHIRSKYPAIVDKQGQLRLSRRQQGDNWDAFLSLTAKRR